LWITKQLTVSRLLIPLHSPDRLCALLDSSPSGADPEGRLVGDEGEGVVEVEPRPEGSGRPPGIASPPQDLDPVALGQGSQAGDRCGGR
jgi:hypothetical protein